MLGPGLGPTSTYSLPCKLREMDFQSVRSLLLFLSPGGAKHPSSPTLLVSMSAVEECVGGVKRVLIPAVFCNLPMSIADRVYRLTMGAPASCRLLSKIGGTGDARGLAVVCLNVSAVVWRRVTLGDAMGLKTGDDCWLVAGDTIRFDLFSVFSVNALSTAESLLTCLRLWIEVSTNDEQFSLSITLVEELRVMKSFSCSQSFSVLFFSFEWADFCVSSPANELAFSLLSSPSWLGIFGAKETSLPPLIVISSTFSKLEKPFSCIEFCSFHECLFAEEKPAVVNESLRLSLVGQGDSFESEEPKESCSFSSFSSPDEGSRGEVSASEIWTLNLSSSESERTEVFRFPSVSLLPSCSLSIFDLLVLACSEQRNISWISSGSKWHTDLFLRLSGWGFSPSTPKSAPKRFPLEMEVSSFSAAYKFMWFLRNLGPINGQENLRMSCILARHSSKFFIWKFPRISMFSRQALIKSLVVSKSPAFIT